MKRGSGVSFRPELAHGLDRSRGDLPGVLLQNGTTKQGIESEDARVGHDDSRTARPASQLDGVRPNHARRAELRCGPLGHQRDVDGGFDVRGELVANDWNGFGLQRAYELRANRRTDVRGSLTRH